MKKEKEKQKNTFWNYYIKGEYHCDTCPFCFGGDFLPGCDDYEDAGCYIRKELHDSCRLIPPIRFLIGWLPRKRCRYYEAHKYDDAGDWYEEQYEQEQQLEKALETYLKRIGADILPIDIEGNPIKNPKGEYIKFNKEWSKYPDLGDFYFKCKDVLAPYKYESLRTKWKNLIKETWQKFIMLFKPYFCK